MLFNKLKLLFFAGLSAFSTMSVCGQELPKIIPPSPITRAFNKYINYNVSMYNGLPDISIPLYEIKIKGVTIPINLSYHASGIKFRQDDGDVGVGWTLNPGYRVSRTIYGFPDEIKPMPTELEIRNTLNNSYAGLERDKYLARFVSSESNNDRPTSTNDEQLDGQYDMFNFSIPSAGGTFIINDRVNKKTSILERANAKIKYNTGYLPATQTAGILGFEVKDNNGIKYYAGNQANESRNNVYEYSNNGTLVASAWAVTNIVNPEGQQVHFEYSKGTSGSWVSHQLNLTVAEAVTINAGESVMSNVSTPEGHDGGYVTFYLNEISGVHEKATIHRKSGENTVNDIEIRSVDGRLVKRIVFAYSSLGEHNTLESVQIQNQNSSTVETYRFNYYSPISPGGTGHDQWGYYHGYYQNPMVHLFHQEFADDQLDLADRIEGPFYQNQTLKFVFDQFGDRSNVLSAHPDYSLQSITYPTGGSTEYVYESNCYSDEYNRPKLGGGLRIKYINHYSAPNVLASRRTYAYGEGDSGTGNAPLLFSEKLFASETMSLKSAPTTGNDGYHFYEQRVINYSTDLQGDVDPGGFLGSYVVYPFVTEYYSSPQDNGKVTFKYDLQWQFLANRLPK